MHNQYREESKLHQISLTTLRFPPSLDTVMCSFGAYPTNTCIASDILLFYNLDLKTPRNLTSGSSRTELSRWEHGRITKQNFPFLSYIIISRNYFLVLAPGSPDSMNCKLKHAKYHLMRGFKSWSWITEIIGIQQIPNPLNMS